MVYGFRHRVTKPYLVTVVLEPTEFGFFKHFAQEVLSD
jgi:hypothetical protein